MWVLGLLWVAYTSALSFCCGHLIIVCLVACDVYICCVECGVFCFWICFVAWVCIDYLWYYALFSGLSVPLRCFTDLLICFALMALDLLLFIFVWGFAFCLRIAGLIWSLIGNVVCVWVGGFDVLMFWVVLIFWVFIVLVFCWIMMVVFDVSCVCLGLCVWVDFVGVLCLHVKWWLLVF